MKPIIIIAIFVVLYYLTSLKTALVLTTLTTILSLNTPSTNALSARLRNVVENPISRISYNPNEDYIRDVAEAYVDEKSGDYTNVLEWHKNLYLNKLDDTALELVSMLSENSPPDPEDVNKYDPKRSPGEVYVHWDFRVQAMNALFRKFRPTFRLSREAENRNLTSLYYYDFDIFVRDFPDGWDSAFNKQNVVELYNLAYNYNYDEFNQMTGLIDLFDEKWLKNQYEDDIRANREGMRNLFIFKLLKWLRVPQDPYRSPYRYPQNQELLNELKQNDVPSPYTRRARAIGAPFSFAKRHAATIVKNVAKGNLPTDVQGLIFKQLQ